MAFFVPSALVKAQAKLLEKFQAGELRVADPVTYKAFLNGAPVLFPEAKMLRTREDRQVDTYYALRTPRALGSARVHNPSGASGDSGALTLSYATSTDKFSISMKQADNNVFTYE